MTKLNSESKLAKAKNSKQVKNEEKPKRVKLTKEQLTLKLTNIALAYLTLDEFEKSAKKAYDLAKKLGVLKKVTSHMREEYFVKRSRELQEMQLEREKIQARNIINNLLSTPVKKK